MRSDRIANLLTLLLIFGAGAVRAAVEPSGNLDPVTHNPAPAVLTNRREPVHGAFE
jgi:hypothetical protein